MNKKLLGYKNKLTVMLNWPACFLSRLTPASTNEERKKTLESYKYNSESNNVSQNLYSI